MPTSYVRVYVEEGNVLVKYDGEVINKLDPTEAQKCGGNIQKAGKIADENPEKTLRSPVKGANNLNRDNRSRTKKRSQYRGEDGQDWKGENKNHLLNGSI
jgi:hypothetical protein